jgi:hypothetical protein
MRIVLLSLAIAISLFAQDKALIEEKNCQYRDKFFDKCKYYSKKYILIDKSIECTQECQHWDSFFQKCLYEKKCKFDKKNRIFMQKECDVWDSFFKKCKEEKSTIIRPEPKPEIKVILKREYGG